ncbi:MAG: hypothetical protein ACE5FH_10775 [Candidatus Zixiibacteriota bacterium]
MTTDFENRPLKDENGEIIRYDDGKPVLYKHFLNDLPDEELKLTAEDWAKQYKALNFPVPENILSAIKAGSTEKRTLRDH